MSTQVAVQENTAVPPSRDRLRVVSLLLVAAGLFVSGYLSYTKLTQTAMVCVEGGMFNCDVVANSVYSRLFGIEIAYLGFLTYLLIGGLLALQNRISLLRDYSTVLVFGVTLFAFLFSMWLVYVQVALLRALCPWCLAHEVIITLLFVSSAVRLWQTLKSA